MNVKLRPTSEEDLDFVVSAEGDPDVAPFIIRWPRSRHEAALTDHSVVHRVVESPDGGRVGFAILVRGALGPSVEFLRLVVTERGLGYGRGAVKAAKQLAFDGLGCDRLWLDVFDDNERARSLYASEGFKEVGTGDPVPGRRPLLVMEARRS